MICRLILKYEFAADGDDCGLLFAQVDTPRFKAGNEFWVQWQDITYFAASLVRYPIGHDELVVAEWGFSEKDQYVEVTKVVVRPPRATGGPSVHVLLADQYKPDNRCSVQFETDYPALGKFADELTLMMQERSGSASLNGWANGG